MKIIKLFFFYGINNSNCLSTVLNISIVSAIPPIPISPHFNFFTTDGICTKWNSSFIILICFSVIKCSYIKVFMANAKNPGFLKSQALITQVFNFKKIVYTNKLSQIPFVILASVLADKGANKIPSAHFLN